MGYECRVERDSINVQGDRLVTFVIRYPRVCLAEVVTHRLVYEEFGEDVYVHERTAPRDQSKSSASSRAIPLEKMIETVRKDPYVPEWTGTKRGMQGADIKDAWKIKEADRIWLNFMEHAIDTTLQLDALGIHKQDANRCLENWAWVTQICTSSRWDNFFALRCHDKAFPPFRYIARMMYLHLRKSEPTPLEPGQWHLPFVPADEQAAFRWVPNVGDMLHGNGGMPDLIKRSAARCAWGSYMNHDKDASDEAHFRTYNSLFAEIPVHGGPVEHQATPANPATWAAYPRVRSNLSGYVQARKLIPHEEVKLYSPNAEEIERWGITV